METVKTIKEVRQKVREWRADGLTIGLVPTMGFLHEGHRSLIERAAAENDRVIVSDFVNPTQFGAGEDLESYPRDIERDQNVCLAAGADLKDPLSKDKSFRVYWMSTSFLNISLRLFSMPGLCCRDPVSAGRASGHPCKCAGPSGGHTSCSPRGPHARGHLPCWYAGTSRPRRGRTRAICHGYASLHR